MCLVRKITLRNRIPINRVLNLAIKQKKAISLNELRRRRVLLYRGLLVLLLLGLIAWFLLVEIFPDRWYDPKESWWRKTLVVLPWIYTVTYLGVLGMIARLLIWSGFSGRELEHDLTHSLFAHWRVDLSKPRGAPPNDIAGGTTNLSAKSQQSLVEEKREADIETTRVLRVDLRAIRRFRVLLYRGLLVFSVLSLGLIGFMLVLILVFPEFFTNVTALWFLPITLFTVIYAGFGCMYTGAFLGAEFFLHWFAVSPKVLKRDIFPNLFKNWHEDRQVLSNA